MEALGINVHLDGERIVVRAVAASDAGGNLAAREAFSHTTDPSDDLAQRLRGIVDHLATELRTSDYDVVVVRVMDWNPRQRASTVSRRSQVDGALIAEARRYAPRVAAMSGRDMGALRGGSKEAIETEAAEIVGGDLTDAGAAALAGLSLGQAGN